MDRINFINGQKPSLSAENLNKLQDNMEAGIKEETEKATDEALTRKVVPYKNVLVDEQALIKECGGLKLKALNKLEGREVEQEGEPTPNNPSEVKTATGNVEGNVSNKNLAKLWDTTKLKQNEDDIELISYTNGMKLIDVLLPAGNYTISLVMLSKPTTTTTFSNYLDNVNINANDFVNLNTLELNKVYTRKITLTKTTQLKYAIWGNTNADLFKFKFQIEKGDVATDYTPHQSQVFPLTLGSLELCKIGDYVDYIYRNGSKWFKRSNVGKKIFTSSDITRYERNGNGIYQYRTEKNNLSDLKVNPDPFPLLRVAYCNRFKKLETANEMTEVGFTLSGNKEMVFNTEISTLAEFKTWIDNNQTILYYLLATPTDTEITDTTLITQLNALENAKLYEGITNISITGDNLTPIADIDYWTWFKGEGGELANESEIKNLILATKPVGTIEFNTSGVNPSEYIGGTWVAWGSGRVPVGVDTSDSSFNTVEKTGGEKTHTLTTNEMPSHKHNVSSLFSWSDTGSNIGGSGLTTVSLDNTVTSGSTGGGQAHNNLQPYITCYMWKRTE